jgi:hypothetical protein
MSDEKTLFVFYTFEKPASWEYGRMPKGWWWVGSGSTGSLLYDREEQFMGPVSNQDRAARHLESCFKKLKERGILKRFKIRKSYLP